MKIHQISAMACLILTWMLSACSTSSPPEGQPEPPDPPEQLAAAPRVIGAASISNTSVVVTFSNPMDDSALAPASYVIVQQNVNPEVGFLPVMGNTCSESSTDAGDSCAIDGECPGGSCRMNGPVFTGPAQTGVRLTTASQNEVTYELQVVNVQDLTGHELAPPELLVNPSEASFAGTPPTGADIVDSDGDGVPDNAELRGRLVSVVRSNGTVATMEVTSDPFSSDTDNDGLDDGIERQINTNPRATDTDGDLISDFDEFNTWFSSPIHQDTDADGIDDNLEINLYKTSALFADTDGDQLLDGDEVLVGNRDPRVVDMPGHRIKLGNITLTLDTRITHTDTQGETETSTTSEGTTLSRGESETYSTSDTDTIKATIESANKLGFEVSSPKGGGVSGETQLTVGFSAEHATSVSESSTASSQEAYHRSLQGSTSLQSITQITTEVVDATMKVDVTIENVGNTAFTISNLELTALVQDPRDRTQFLPVASLTPESNTLNEINLGPLLTERGPFVFSAREVFVSQVQQLMKNPAGMLIKVANFDITDEFERNFAFTSQEIFDRTAGIVIDFGDGTVQRARVATHGTYDPATGRANGITMRYALEDILDLAKGAADGYDTTRIDSDGDGTLDVDILTRVGEVETVLEDDPSTPALDERQRFWVVFSNQDFDPLIDFDALPLNSGFEVSLAFVQDKDDDGIYARVEFLYGSSDRNANTDGCPDPGSDGIAGSEDDLCLADASDCLSDFEEINDGWLVAVEGQLPYHSYPDPVQPDSDGDRLLDHQERCYGTDPRQRDTDLDGISDYDEIFGMNVNTAGGLMVYTIEPYAGQVVLDGGNGIVESSVAGNDEQVEPLGVTVILGAIIIDGGEDGVEATTSLGGDDYIAAHHFVGCDSTLCAGLVGGCVDTPCAAGFGTDPLNADTDGDGIYDGAERDIAKDQGPDGDFINANNVLDGAKFRDADRDGVADLFEEQGFEALINGQLVTVTSDKFDADSDDDFLPDLLEHMLGSDPRSADTDGDGINDLDEFKEGDSCISSSDAAVVCNSFAMDYVEFLEDCAAAEGCSYVTGDAAARGSRTTGTNMNEADSDGDQLTDPFELDTGWQLNFSGPEVFPDPLNPNSDLDLIDDHTEGTARTDPYDEDTDDDGANDDLEVLQHFSRCVNSFPCTDPHVADQRVGVTFVELSVGEDDCDPLFGPGEFNYFFELRRAGSTSFITPVSSSIFGNAIPCTSCSGIMGHYDNIDSNQSVTFNVKNEFIMLMEGENFRIKGGLQELSFGFFNCGCGDSCCAAETWIPDETFEQSDLPGLGSFTDFTFSGGSGCLDDDRLEIRIHRD